MLKKFIQLVTGLSYSGNLNPFPPMLAILVSDFEL